LIFIRLGTYYRYIVIKTLNLPLAGNEILDIGCYDGFLLSHIKAKEKVGIDINILKRYACIRYIEDNLIDHDFEQKKFDRIFALDVIEHVRDDKIFLKKVIQLLDTEGIAILSTTSKNIKIFPGVFQGWIDYKWEHIYRRGYDEENIKKLLSDFDKSIRLDITYWNCPFFRLLYLPLNLTWRIFPELTKRILDHIVKLDSRFRKGRNGYIYIIIEKLWPF
jgi:SAM-dependent methyltransferase